MTLLIDQYAERYARLRERGENPDSAPEQRRLERASAAWRLAQQGLTTAENSRKPGKAERVEAAESLLRLAKQARLEAQEALEVADADYERNGRNALLRLHADIATTAAQVIDPEAVILFTKRVATGEVRTQGSYGDFRVHRVENTESFEEDTFALEFGDVRVRFQGSRDDLRFEVELLTDEKMLEGGEVRAERFGYSASASISSFFRDDPKSEVSWGSYSGMKTVANAEDTVRVHRVAIELGRILEGLLA